MTKSDVSFILSIDYNLRFTMRDIKSSTFDTSDISLAAFLYASGIELAEVSDNRFPTIFAFMLANNKIEELIADFQRGEATINVTAYYRAYKYLISRLKGSRA